MNYLLVALGSALGGMARFWVASLTLPSGPWPTATLLVNVVGSFLIGCVAVAVSASDKPVADQVQLFFAVGVFGGFTTFSAFSLQTLNLLQSGQVITAVLYTTTTVILCLLAVAAGWWLTQQAVS